MQKRVSFKDYSFCDKVYISMVMGFIALCGVISADRYIKNDLKGTSAGVVGMGASTILAAKLSKKFRRNARHRIYRHREYN